MSRLEPVEEQHITARLAGAASMRTELEHVLSAVGPDATPAKFRTAILDDNAARKGSYTARDWAWRRLKLRYALDSTDTPESKAFTRAMRDPDTAARGLTCFLMLARTDRLFRDSSLELVAPKLEAPGTEIDPAEVHSYVEQRRADAQLEWSPTSLRAIAGHILTSWKDFGVVEGSKTRRVARLSPRSSTTRFAVELAKAGGLTDRQSLEAIWFRLLGMDFGAADTAMRAAAREGVLRYRSQADVVEIDLSGEG